MSEWIRCDAKRRKWSHTRCVNPGRNQVSVGAGESTRRTECAIESRAVRAGTPKKKWNPSTYLVRTAIGGGDASQRAIDGGDGQNDQQ